MAELRKVDPRALLPNDNNARQTPVPEALDQQMVASIIAVGILQPPVVREVPKGLMIRYGHRRVKNAIAAGKSEIDVIVADGDDAGDGIQSAIENLIRAPMTAVDTWRTLGSRLDALGWTEQAIADALNLPLRRVRCMKLLANVHPPMLDVMAAGSMPHDDQLRIIASAPADEQAQVWKKHKPRKGDTACDWHSIANALRKRRIPFSAAKFDDTLAKAYGVVWEDDLFTPAGQDGRYTTNVEGFLGAQQEWMQNNLPKRGTILPVGTYGEPTLPKKAERVYGTPGKKDITGHYVDPQTAEVRTVVYRLPQPKPAPKAGGKSGAADTGDTTDDAQDNAPQGRPPVSQTGLAMIGDLRTNAIHLALNDAPIEDDTLMALLVLAFAANNVTVMSGAGQGSDDRRLIVAPLTPDDVLAADTAEIRKAARAILVSVYSCRANATNSGEIARIAAEAIGAETRLPNMATDEFLSCLSRATLEGIARDAGIPVAARVRDTRAAIVKHYADQRFIFPVARFAFTDEEKKDLAERRAEDKEWLDDGSADGAEDGESDAGDATGANTDGNDGNDDQVAASDAELQQAA